MRRLIFTFIGLVILVAGGALLWVSIGPQPKEERTTGGVLTTQAEIAAQNLQAAPGTGPDLGVISDQGPGSTNSIGAQPEIASDALEDVATLDTAEAEALPQVAAAPDMTTDVILDNQTDVAVAPLNLGEVAPMTTPDGQGGATTPAGFYEQRVVEMEWPRSFRVGGASSIRVTLKVLADGSLQPVAEVAENEVLATPILITDRYDTHNATVTATLSAPDFTVEAVNDETQPMERGQQVEWRWTLEANKGQRSVIALGIRINWQPKPGTVDSPTSANIWGQSLQADVDYVFGGLTVPQASALGTALAVLGFVAQFPLALKVLQMVRDIVFGRSRRTRSRRSSTSRRRR